MNYKKSVPMNGNSLAPVNCLRFESKTKLPLCYTKNQVFVPYLSLETKGGING